MGPLGAGRTRHITKKGRTITLTRDNATSVTLLGFFSLWNAEQIDGTVLRQGDARIDIFADLGDYPVPPRDPDLITTGDSAPAYTVIFANPVYEGEQLIGWTIAARGE
jgi:hypothetical protein